jgi:hypothetical protein
MDTSSLRYLAFMTLIPETNLVATLRRSITDAQEQSAGKAQRVQNVSLSVFIASICTAVAVFIAALVLFILLKDHYVHV